MDFLIKRYKIQALYTYGIYTTKTPKVKYEQVNKSNPVYYEKSVI